MACIKRDITDIPEAGFNYSIKTGDNLWSVAKRAYGAGAYYPVIVKANNIINPSLIYPNQLIYIPVTLDLSLINL